MSATQRIRGLLYLIIIGSIIFTVKVDTAIRKHAKTSTTISKSAN